MRIGALLPTGICNIYYVQGPLLRCAPYEEYCTMKRVPTHDLPPVHPGSRIRYSNNNDIWNMPGILPPARNQLPLGFCCDVPVTAYAASPAAYQLITSL